MSSISLDDIPSHVWMLVLGRLDRETLRDFARTSKGWNSLVRADAGVPLMKVRLELRGDLDGAFRHGFVDVAQRPRQGRPHS